MSELHFKGKEFVFNHHLTVPHRPLLAHPGKSIGDKSENLIIHGDNLHALKSLLVRYAGKVDCICIDPPYNTGNENWNYNDNVNSPIMKEWLDGNPINQEDMLRHDKWCCMIYPRLKLLHELLSEEGVIFVFIDDNEQHRLRMALDEVFGEANFIAQFVAQTNPRGRSLRSDIAQTHEYVLGYAKNSEFAHIRQIPKTEKALGEYDHEDADGRFRFLRLRNSGIQFFNRETRPNLFFPIYVNPSTGCVSLQKDEKFKIEVLPLDPQRREGCWTWGKDKVKDENHLLRGRETRTGEWRIYRKDYLPITGDATTKERSLWTDKDVNHEVGKEVLTEIFSDAPFPHPKSPQIMARLINLACDKDGIVLDSFAGSATTAHAVLAQNAKDGGNRRFILVECEDYADTLTAERVRRVINGYQYTGTQKEELLRENITWSSFSRDNIRQKLLDQVQHLENQESGRFDSIKKEIKDGELIVTGEKKITRRVEGLGGSFTYYTLDTPLELDAMLTRKNLPDYASIGAWLFQTATGESLNQKSIKEKQNYLGESQAFYVWLIYKPDLSFLKSRDSALTSNFAEEIARKKDKRHLVFASTRLVSSKRLLRLGVEHAPLPFALYRIEKS